MKLYEYSDDSWYDRPACDCCEGLDTLMPCYNLLNDVDCYTYSCHTEEDCYRQVLEIEGVLDEADEQDLSYDQLKMLCLDNDIDVVVKYDESLEEFGD